MLAMQKHHLHEKIEREKKANTLPQLAYRILQLAKDHGRITVAFVSNALDANRGHSRSEFYIDLLEFIPFHYPNYH